MKKHYCDNCGNELKNHEGHFLCFQNYYYVDFWKWNIFSKVKFKYEERELCENCFYSLLTLYQEEITKKKVENAKNRIHD